MNKNKLKAFTVLEMLINMAITAIIIGTVYYAYLSFSKQVSLYQKTIEEEMNLDSFLTQLKTDFFKAEKIIQSKDQSFNIIFYNEEEINYSANDNYFLRVQNSNVDSIEIKKIDIQTEVNTVNQEKRVKKATVFCSLFSESIEFSVSKNNTTPINYGNQYK